MTEKNQRQRMKFTHGSFMGKSTDENTGTPLLRYLFTSDNRDEMGDTITRAATEEATERWREWRNIRFQHDPGRPIGKAVRIGKADGLDWNAMDVRIDDPDALLLTQGDDPVLGGASVGIWVKEWEVDESEEAVALADPWEPWVITGYDFVEISLVDHPANYDAKRIGEVEAGRSVLLFRRRDLLDNKEDKTMSITNNEVVAEELVEEVLVEEALEAPVVPAETEEAPADSEHAVDSPAPVVEELGVEEPEEGEPDPALVALGEIKGMITALGESLTVKMDTIQAFMTPVEEAAQEPEPDEVVQEPALEEALPQGEPVEEVEPTEPETEDGPIAVLSRRIEQIYERVFGTEAEDEEVEAEADDFDLRVEQKVKEVLAGMERLQPRKSAAVEEEDIQPKETQNPQVRLRSSVARAFQTREEQQE